MQFLPDFFVRFLMALFLCKGGSHGLLAFGHPLGDGFVEGADPFTELQRFE